MLVLMVYSALNTRAGYRISDKVMAAIAKPGYLPQVLGEHGVFVSFWQNFTIEVNMRTADQDGVNAMMALLAAVSDMMALPYGASQREIDEAWLLAAHRILFRLDLACHHADLAYLAKEDPRELPQSKLRVQMIVSASARASASAFREAPRDAPRDNRSFKRPRGGESRGGGGFSRDRPLIYCDQHKRMVRHTSAECHLRARAPSDSGK